MLNNNAKDKEEPHYLGHRMRLKEKFLKDGGKNLADYELLELLLMLAIPRRDVKEKAKDLIKHFGSFNKVITADIKKLKDYGLSVNIISALKLVCSAAVKLSWQELKEKETPVFSNFDYMIDYCRAAMAHLEIEEFRVIFLNAHLQPICEEVLQKGCVTNVSVHPREVVKAALYNNAVSVVLLHNHPGGRANPSDADINLTQLIIAALNTVGIFVYDHIIITKNSYFSFLEKNLIKHPNKMSCMQK